jgi:hypothetical protein
MVEKNDNMMNKELRILLFFRMINDIPIASIADNCQILCVNVIHAEHGLTIDIFIGNR